MQIKKFIEKVSYMDSRSSRDLILSANDARMLRDEIVTLIINKLEEEKNKNKKTVNEVTVTGGRW